MTKASNPTPSFNRAALHLATVDSGTRFGRIILNRHSDPLGFGKTRSRFSDPRRRISSHRFGVIYLGETLKVCFLEAVLRDSRNGAVGDYPMDERELHVRCYAEIEITAPLSLVDLRGEGAIRMGVPSDVARASRQSLGRAWSLASISTLPRLTALSTRRACTGRRTWPSTIGPLPSFAWRMWVR